MKQKPPPQPQNELSQLLRDIGLGQALALSFYLGYEFLKYSFIKPDKPTFEEMEMFGL
jgi:hypothetical protein